MNDSRSEEYQFLITRGAQEDLEACAEDDPRSAAFLATFLRELRGDPGYLERMIDESFSDDRVQDVCGVWSLQNKRINAYRTKFVTIRNWRLIFVVDRPTMRIGLFAVMHRDEDYQSNVELWKDIEREFDAFGFTKY